MTRNRRFVNSFWETDFNGTLGFDCLCKHIRDGQKTCKDIEDFFKKRAKAEQSYSKSLNTLAKSSDGKEESGVLGLSWQELRSQTEKVAHYHETVSSEYSALAEEIARFTDDLKQISKPMEDKVKDSQRAKKNAYNKMLDLQKTYNTRCREMVQHDNQLLVANQSVTTSSKEIEKTKSKVEKSKEAMEQSDVAYKQAVEVLERTRRSWEADMEEACELFQKQEEERISFLRNQLWKSTNIDSQLCVDWDESCEKIRLCLENCDIEKDIQDFIDVSYIGSTRPAPILYENYLGEKTNGKPTDNKISPRPNRKLPPIPGAHTAANLSTTEVYSYATIQPDSLYSLPESEQRYKVIKPFMRYGNGGMVAKCGDIVKLISKETKSGLVKVQLEGSLTVGLMPLENLQPI